MECYRSVRWKIFIWGIGLMVIFMGCSSSSEIIATPTPTSIGGGVAPTPTEINICQGLGGELEMQVLVGPAEAVGLEPVAVGSIPFSVNSDEGIYIVQGSGSIAYQDVLEEEWGTYSINFDMEAVLSGECEGDAQSGTLNVMVETSGEQNVEVRAEGFQGDYPWSGTHEFDLSMPIMEGATAEGEGWAFVLHINE